MIKHREEADPGSCLSKAKDDEMVFVLLARDSCAADTIRFWTRLRIYHGKNQENDPQIVEALACADYMERQREGRLPLPDLHRDTEP